MGYLRNAMKQDMELLFDWANEDLVRKNAFSTEKISYEDHKKWFRNLLSRDDVRQYIYVDNDENVGQVRVTVEGVSAEIDYSVCSKKRDRGYGKEMIHLLAEQVRKDFPEVKRLVAKVKPENAASSKVFLDSGYVEKYRFYELEMDLSGNIE